MSAIAPAYGAASGKSSTIYRQNLTGAAGAEVEGTDNDGAAPAPQILNGNIAAYAHRRVKSD